MRIMRHLTSTDLATANTTMSSLGTRLTAVESGKADISVTGSLTTRMGLVEMDVTSLKSWRAAKISSPDVPSTVSVPTAVITLGLNAPTVAGINALGNTIMGEINAMKSALRTREIFV